MLDVGQNFNLPVINVDTDLSGPLDAYEVYYPKDIIGASKLTIRTITGLPTDPSGVSTSTSGDLAIGDIAKPPAGIQPDASVTLDTGKDIVSSASFRAGTLWLSSPDACQPNGVKSALSCLRVIRVDNADSASPIKIADTDFYTKDVSLMYPAITMDENNDTFITYNYSSASVYPSVEVLLAPLGSLSFSGAVVRLGDGPVPADVVGGNSARFGDYSGIGIDGSDPTRVWVAGEFGPSFGYLWDTSVAEYGFI